MTSKSPFLGTSLRDMGPRGGPATGPKPYLYGSSSLLSVPSVPSSQLDLFEGGCVTDPQVPGEVTPDGPSCYSGVLDDPDRRDQGTKGPGFSEGPVGVVAVDLFFLSYSSRDACLRPAAAKPAAQTRPSPTPPSTPIAKATPLGSILFPPVFGPGYPWDHDPVERRDERLPFGNRAVSCSGYAQACLPHGIPFLWPTLGLGCPSFYTQPSDPPWYPHGGQDGSMLRS